MKAHIFALVSAYSLSLASALKQPSATLSAGVVLGTQCPQTEHAVAFRGIPYAEAPIGDLRFAIPVSYNGTFEDGLLQAIQNPPFCIQFGEGFNERGSTSEE